MKRMHMPMVDARYWLGITLASIFGTNLGDLYAHELDLGIYLGIAILAALAAIVFLVERRDDRPNESFYWLVIIIIRTGATNIADFLASRSHAHLPRLPLSVGFALLIALFGWLAARSDSNAPTDTADLPPTGPAYWAAMLSAGIFGTLVGDICSHSVGQGIASLGLAAVLAVALLIWAKGHTRSFALYWLTIAAARSAGTSMGDWLAENPILHIGLPLSTLLTGTVFTAVLLCWRGRTGVRSSVA